MNHSMTIAIWRCATRGAVLAGVCLLGLSISSATSNNNDDNNNKPAIADVADVSASSGDGQQQRPGRFKVYSRTWMWTLHLVLALSLYLHLVLIVSTKNSLEDKTVILLHVLTLSLLIYLDGVHLVGQSLQKRFLALYLSLVLLGGLDLLLQPLSALPLLLFLLSLASSILSFLVCYCNPYKLQSREPTAEATANLWPYVSFSYLHAILIHPGMAKKSLEYEDIPGLCDDDSAEVIAERFEKILLRHHDQQQQTSAGHRREEGDEKDEPKAMKLADCVYCMVKPLCYRRAIWQFLCSLSLFLAPLALEKIVIFVNCHGDQAVYESEGFLSVDIRVAVFLFFLGPAVQTVCLGQSFFMGRRIGMRIRAALVDQLYRKALVANLTAAAGKDSMGKINNLISVDVDKILEYWAYAQFMWSAPLEIIVAMALLCQVLGRAAIAGIIAMAVQVGVGIFITSWMNKFQQNLMSKKDDRMNLVTELLNSIRIIKFFAWESKFLEKVQEVRRRELWALLETNALRALLFIIWQTTAIIVAMTAFLVYSQYLGHQLTVSTGFTAMSLFNLLRFPVGDLPELIGRYVCVQTSLQRIESFLNSKEVVGLPAVSPISSKRLRLGSVEMRNVTIAWQQQQPSHLSQEEEDGKDNTATKLSFLQSTVTSCASFGSRFGRCCCVGNSSDYQAINSVDDTNEDTTPSPQIILENVNLDIVPGTLNVIIGSTGAGKTTLLQGLLGEALVLGGERLVYGSLSYSSQSAWIQNATLRENILFGSDYDEERYEAVLHACALKADLALLPGGDQTEIGEKGVNLSGGQQQRVSLARAAYARSDIILLDDPLSAVDAHVGEHIFRELILGFLKCRTVLLITHSLSLALPHADQILCIDGEMRSLSHSAKPLELFEVLQASYGKGGDAEVVVEEEQVAVMRDGTTASSFLKSVYSVLKSILQPQATAGAVRIVNDNHPAQEDSVEEILSTIIPYQDSSGKVKEKEKSPAIARITVDEAKTPNRNLSFLQLGFYFKAAGGTMVLVLMVGICLAMSVAWFGQNYRLAQWMNATTNSNSSHAANEQLFYYICTVLFLIAMFAMRAGLQMFIAKRASESIHGALTRSVLLAPLAWFDATPIGRIINRFSEDMNTIDDEVIIHLMDLTDDLLCFLQILVVIVYFLPRLLLLFVPVLSYAVYVAYQYRPISGELKKLESLRKTPVFVQFAETLQGLATIRSFPNQKRRFVDHFRSAIDGLDNCFLYLWRTHRWLNFRATGIGAVVSGLVASAIVWDILYHQEHGGETTLSSSSAALALTYSIIMCDTLTQCVWSYGDTFNDLNNIDRLDEYTHRIPSERYGETMCASLPDGSCSSCCVVGRNEHVQRERKQEEEEGDVEMGLLQSCPLHRPSSSLTDAAEKSNGNVPSSWPSHGQVTFRHLSLRYASSSSPVLRDVSFDIPAGSKVGVVGRTGAGKSSLITALFRLVEPESGELWIDGVDVLRLPLQRLRSRLAIVPQEPTLFRGSLRSNMDPFGEHSDEEIWGALRAARLEEKLWSYLPSGGSEEAKRREEESGGGSGEGVNLLDSLQVAEKGSNFSLGQRQLLCMARAILRKAKVLVLDECTASVDHDTDAMIQETVRYGLSACTVICIAHRLHTVAYYDRILLLERGQVQEFGCPYELLEDSQSAFHALCQASGAFEDLRTIARQAAQSRGISLR